MTRDDNPVESLSQNWMEARMQQALQRRRERGTLRQLPEANATTTNTAMTDVIDFSSNDYLGLAHDPAQAELCRSWALADERPSRLLGATGSRLLSGDSAEFHALEGYLARIHRRSAAVLCNSGYDANLTVVSSLACDDILCDEFIHNSLHMGLRLWKTQDQSKEWRSFRHNDVADLTRQLQQNRQGRSTVVLIESVYSMDGDVAPLKEMLDLCAVFKALLVVDEAHGLGVYGCSPDAEGPGGTGVLARDGLEDHPSLLCSIYTFGKAAGCHGAVVCGSETLKNYLLNYGYPLIYSTALPYHSLVTIRCAYETMTGRKGDELRYAVSDLIRLFRERLEPRLTRSGAVYLLPSTSPIQALMIHGNDACSQFCQLLYAKSSSRIRLFPIKSPTVPVDQERIRIILHSHNTVTQVAMLVDWIQETLEQMGLLYTRSRL